MKKNCFNLRRIKNAIVITGLCLMLTATSAFFQNIYAAPYSFSIDGVKYTNIKDGKTLYSGNYALYEDITLTKQLVIVGNTKGNATVIYLNGKSMSGIVDSDKPAIVASKNAVVIIKDKEGSDGKILATFGNAISIDGGSLTLENVEISQCSQAAVSAMNASITINNSKITANGSANSTYGAITAVDCNISIESSEFSGNTSASDGCAISLTQTDSGSVTCGLDINNSVISNNSGAGSAVYCDGSFDVTVRGDSTISANTIGLKISDNINLTIAENSKLAGNSSAGLLLSEGKVFNIGNDNYSAGTDMKIEPAILNVDGSISGGKILISRDVKDFKNCFSQATDLGLTILLSDELSGTSCKMLASNCPGHQYSYEIDGVTVTAVCSICGTRSTVALVNNAYFDTRSNLYFTNNLDSDIYVDLDSWDGYRVKENIQVYYTSIDSETGEIVGSFEQPTAEGKYTVCLMLTAEKDNADSAVIKTQDIPFAIMCSKHTWEYYVEGGSVFARCTKCGGILVEATLKANNFDLDFSADKKYTLYACRNDAFEVETKAFAKNMGTYSFVTVYGYYKEDGSISYSTKAPTEVGEYTIKLAVLKRATSPTTAVASTEEIKYTYAHHDWGYHADGNCIHAICNACGDEASVFLDGSKLYDDSKAYADDENNTVGDYNLVYENGWSTKEDIAQYKVLYKSLLFDNCEYEETKPAIEGYNRYYCAKLVVETGNETISSNELVYYSPETTLAESYYTEIRKLNDSDYAAMNKPEVATSIDGRTTYKVYSDQDLYWISKYGDMNADISIEQDIVLNPLIVSGDGTKVYAAGRVVYNWPGIGTSSNPYCGSVYGNSHTIYGFYSELDNNNSDTGLIAYGLNIKNISDLNVCDSVINGGNNAGVIAGSLSYKSDNLRTIVNNCHVIDCKINNANRGGGIVGRVFSIKKVSVHDFDNCSFEGYVKANYAGGIIGEIYYDYMYDYSIAININNCCNLGEISGLGSYAGGIVAYIDGYHHTTNIGETGNQFTSISSCRNLGYVQGNFIAGGIVGYSYSDSFKYVKYSDNQTLKMFEVLDLVPVNEQYIYLNTLGLKDCINIGTINVSTVHGALIGTLKQEYITYFSNNAYFGSSNAIGEYPSTDETGHAPYKLTKDQARYSNLCKGYHQDEAGNVIVNSERSYNHLSGQWHLSQDASCETDGELTRSCLICGEVLETKTISAKGHNYVNGTCSVCSAIEENTIASIFSKNGHLICMAIGIVVVATSVIIIRSKKRKA